MLDSPVLPFTQTSLTQAASCSAGGRFKQRAQISGSSNLTNHRYLECIGDECCAIRTDIVEAEVESGESVVHLHTGKVIYSRK